jgi:DNA ligase (NAD+)
MDMKNIEELAGKYLLHSELYRAGLARISDKEFNKLEEQLKTVAPDHPVLSKVNKGLALKGLANNSFDDWYSKIPEDESLIIQPKIDGIAILLRYVDGILVAAFNRTGKDKTYHMRFVDNIPQFIDARGTVHIRGELYAPNEAPSNSQRIAAGHVRKSAPEKTEVEINFCAFQVVDRYTTELDQLRFLQNGWGFEIPRFAIADKKKNKRDYIKECHDLWLDSRFFSNYIPTDGIVVKPNNKSLRNLYPMNSKTQRGLIAIKDYWKDPN